MLEQRDLNKTTLRNNLLTWWHSLVIQDLKSCQRVLEALQYAVDMTPTDGMSSYVAWEAYSQVEINMQETFSECSLNQIVGNKSVLD